MTTDTPTQQLAEEILDALHEAGLIAETDRDKALPKLVQGKMSAQDWQLAVETAEEKEARQ